MLLANSNKKIKIIVALFMIITLIGALLGIYLHAISGKYDYLNGTDFVVRGINTPYKLWIDGHFGMFFRTKYFGFLPLLAIPSLLYFGFSIDKRPQWQKAFLFVYLLSFLLIAIEGYTNYRYAFTLYPFTIITVFSFIAELYDKFASNRKLIVILLIILLSLDVVNNFKGYNRTVSNFKRHISVADLINYTKTLNLNKNNNLLTVDITDFYYYSDFKAIMYYTIQPKIKTTADLSKIIQQEHIKYILADDYVFKRSDYSRLSSIIKKNGKLIKKVRSVALYSL